MAELRPVWHQSVFTHSAACSSRDSKASFSLQEAHLPYFLWTAFPSLGEKRFLEIFSQRLFSRSWGGPRGPNSQGKVKPHVGGGGAPPSRGDVAMLWAQKAEHCVKGDYSWALRFNVICLIRFWMYVRLLLLSCFSLLELECLSYPCPTIVFWKCIACLVSQVRSWGGICSGWLIPRVLPVYDLDDV